MKAALKYHAREERALESAAAKYHVRKWYRQNQTGRNPAWMKPIPCLCRVKHYSQGYTSPCGRWVCSDYVRRERIFQLENSDIMTERKKNATYWKQMRARADKKYRKYAKDNRVDIETARFEMSVLRELDKAERDAIWEEAALYIPSFLSEEE